MKLPLSIGAKAASAIYDADGVPVCVIDSMQEASRSEEAKIAARIVACVNACEGMPDSALKPSIIMAQAVQAQELIAQRDELLAALEAQENFWAMRERYLGELSPEAQAVRDKNLAAIARAKGGAK